jgi:hypothetical protein
MTDDPNKKQNDPNYSGGQQGQHNKQGEQQRKSPDDNAQKRPSQGGRDTEMDNEKQDQGGQRRVS